MSKIPVGIIGCGNISKIYARNGRRFEDYDVIACADLDPKRAEALAAEEGIARALTVDELLTSRDVQLVINLTVPAAHADIALRAVKNGKHVYNEKPLAIRRRDARKFIRLAREKKLRVGCAPDTFLGAGLQTCRKLIDDGAIGEPVAGTAFMLSRGTEDWHPNPEFFYKKGSGPLFDMGPYYLTALMAMLGPIRRVAGSARISFPQRKITSEPLAGAVIDVEVFTHVAAVMDFESGPLVTMTTSFDVCGANVPCIEIYGSEGSLSVPDPNTFGGPVRLLRRGEKEWQDIPLPFGYAENSRGIGAADMANAIATGRDHRANERIAYHVLDAMHSIVDAAESRCAVELKSTMSRPEPLPEGLEFGKISGY